MSEPEQDDPHAMRSDMSDVANSSFDDIVQSVQVPRDGGDKADATHHGGPDPDSPSRTGAGSVPDTPGQVGDASDESGESATPDGAEGA